MLHRVLGYPKAPFQLREPFDVDGADEVHDDELARARGDDRKAVDALRLIVDFTPRENIAERVARRFGAAMAEALVRITTVNPVSIR